MEQLYVSGGYLVDQKGRRYAFTDDKGKDVGLTLEPVERDVLEGPEAEEARIEQEEAAAEAEAKAAAKAGSSKS